MSLKKTFNSLEFWDIGYDRMIDMVKNNLGHTKEVLKKENQKKPNPSEQNILNNNYIAIMNEFGFYDQEGVLI